MRSLQYPDNNNDLFVRKPTNQNQLCPGKREIHIGASLLMYEWVLCLLIKTNRIQYVIINYVLFQQQQKCVGGGGGGVGGGKLTDKQTETDRQAGCRRTCSPTDRDKNNPTDTESKTVRQTQRQKQSDRHRDKNSSTDTKTKAVQQTQKNSPPDTDRRSNPQQTNKQQNQQQQQNNKLQF